MLITIREPALLDQAEFLSAMQRSQHIHHPWVKAPLTSTEFAEYFNRSQLSNQKSYLVCVKENYIAGVFNINEIVKGVFQSA